MAKKLVQKAKITKRIQETIDTVTLRLQLSKPFEWEVGQFIMVQAIIDGQSVRRAYSISSSPTRQEFLDITIRQTGTPTMSKYLNEVQEGDHLQVRGPYGKFIWNGKLSNKIVLLGAGSGITPLKAIMEYMIDKNIEIPGCLLYSCGYGDNVIFKNRLEEMSLKINSFCYELSLTKEPMENYPQVRKGRIDIDYLKKTITGYKEANFYLCGAPSFIKAMISNLKELGINHESIKREQWG